jgi:hypothetical protein
MNTNMMLRSLLISLIGVFVIDYLAHLLFSHPMETLPYFIAKLVLYIVFSMIFLSKLDLEEREFMKVALGGVAVALIFGAYYNILPTIFGIYPFGIALGGLSFLGMGFWGTGAAFGIVHTLAFIGGYHAAKVIFKKIS